MKKNCLIRIKVKHRDHLYLYFHFVPSLTPPHSDGSFVAGQAEAGGLTPHSNGIVFAVQAEAGGLTPLFNGIFVAG
jgi:hypothetical protein